MEQYKLEKAVLQTLAFWDIFEHPLTKEELFKYLYLENGQKLDFTSFLSHLNKLEHLQRFQHRDGFYFLSGRDGIVDKRQSRVKWLDKKMQIGKNGIKKIAWLPFVRAVFVCNTLAMGVPDEDSDIDVLIVVKNSRIWLVRFLITFILSIFRLRRTKKKINNKICLSFYLADKNLNLESVALAGNGAPDIYMLYWINSLIPVFDDSVLHLGILKANKWTNNFLPNSHESITLVKKLSVELGRSGRVVKRLLEKLWLGFYGNLLEQQAKTIQLTKMKRNLCSVQNAPDTRVVISDSILKFHENDRREEYRDKWMEKCKNFKF